MIEAFGLCLKFYKVLSFSSSHCPAAAHTVLVRVLTGFLHSAMSQKGLKAVFDEAIRAVLMPAQRPAPKKKGGCTVL